MVRPFVLELKMGERKALCTCNISSQMPFCDGSHKGSGKTPFVVHFKDEQTVSITGTACGQSPLFAGEQETHSGGCCRTLQSQESNLKKEECSQTEKQEPDDFDKSTQTRCCRH